MPWKTTIVLLVLTIGIGLYARYELRQPSREARRQLANQVLDVPEETVTQLILDTPKAKVTLRKTGARWTLMPKAVRVDEALVGRLLRQASLLIVERILTGSAERPLDLKAFGLDPAVATITLVAQEAATTLHIGDTTALRGNRYLQVAGRPEVFIVSAALFDEANQPSESFRDALLIHLDTWAVHELRIASPTTTVTLQQQENRWRLTQPIQDAAGRAEVNRLLSSLSNLPIQRFLNDEPPVEELAAWGFDHPKVELTIREPAPPARQTLPPGRAAIASGEPGPAVPSITVFFGKPLPEDASLVYAKRSDEPPLYAVKAEAVEKLLESPNGLRDKACFGFVPTSVSKVALTREGSGWTLERSAEGWNDSSTGTTADREMVDTFLKDLLDLEISGFEDAAPTDLDRYGLSPPQAVISVWTVDREAPQRLLVGTPVEGTPGRYGRAEEREVVVRLPERVSTLIATTAEQLHSVPQ